jgi:imidazolonepropionase-like amidohydrolase
MHRIHTHSRHTLFVAGLLVLLVVAGWSATARGQAPAAGGVTVFEGARVIVGDGRPPIENATIVMTGNRFTQVGRAADVKVPAGATRVSLAGKTVIPALIDTHTHLSQNREALLNDLRRRPYYGVSAAQSMGQDEGDLAFQMRAEAPKMPGTARFFTAGRGLTAPEPGRTMVPYWITTPAEARKAVQENAAKKVDIIKLWIDDRNGMYKKLTPDLYGAAIEEAHKLGVRVTAHIFMLEDAKGALRANLDAFAHVPARDKDVDDEFMGLIKQHKNVVLNPNLPDRGVKADLTWLRGSLPPAELQKLEEGNTDRPQAQAAFAIQARNLAKMNAAGVRIVLGTDGNTPWAPHVEMADMVAAGMTPAQVIVAATRNAAEFLRMTDAGTIQPNKSADFIVLDANPLDDITNTRKISSVYLRGVAIDRTQRVGQTAAR